MSILNLKLSRYGPGLRVPAAKSLKVICRENDFRKSKSQGGAMEEEVHDSMETSDA